MAINPKKVVWDTDAKPSANAPAVVNVPLSPQQIRENKRADDANNRGNVSTGISVAEEQRRAAEFKATHLNDNTPIPSGYKRSPDGNSYVPIVPPGTNGNATEFQSKSANFYGRMLGSEYDYSHLPGGAKAPRSLIGQQFYVRFPDLYNTFAGLTPQEQQRAQSERNFISASLRQESGAAIGPTEYDNQYRIFYSMPGDSAKVRQQKDAARKIAMAGFKTSAGPLAQITDEQVNAALANQPQFKNAMDNPFFEQGAQPRLLNYDSESKAKQQIPPAMQQENSQYLAEHLGAVDPQEYAKFRADLDTKYGFAPNTLDQQAGNIKFARDLNEYIKNGGRNIPAIGAPVEPLSLGGKIGAAAANNPLTGAIVGAGTSTGLADEVIGGLKSVVKGTPYEQERDSTRAMVDAVRNERPVSTFVGGVGGSVLSGMALAKLAPGAASLLMNNPLKTAAVYGGITGAAENNDNRLAGAGVGSVLGVGGGIVGQKVVAPIAAATGRASADLANDALAKLRQTKLARLVPGGNFTPTPKLTLAERFMGDQGIDGGKVMANLRDSETHNLPYALGDSDPKLQLLSGWASRTTPEARALALQTFDPRNEGQQGRFAVAVDKHLAPETDIGGYGSELLKAGDTAAGPSYNAAMDRAAPVDPQIDAMLKTPAGKAALGHAREIAANEQIDPNSLSFDLNDQGEVVLKSKPNFKTLQLVKRGLDAHIYNTYADQFGNLDLRGSPMAQAVDKLRGRFVKRLGELNPDYAEGNAIWKGYADRKDALDMGYNSLADRDVPGWQFNQAMSNIGPDALPDAQRGMATGMIDRAKGNTANPDPWKYWSGQGGQDNLAAMFPDGVDTFNRLRELERHMAETRYQTVGGSDTAGRVAIDRSMNNDAMPELVEQGGQFLTGGGLSPSRLAKLFGQQRAQKAIEAKANQLAPVLFDTTRPGQMADYVENALKNYGKVKSQRNAYGLLGVAALLNGRF